MNNNKLLLYKVPYLKVINNSLHKKKYNLKINRIPLEQLKINNLPDIQKMPSIIDLRNNFSIVCDQGNIESCTASALCSIIEYDNKNFIGSRLFLFYNENNILNNDNGITIYDNINSLLTTGICTENLWPYNFNNVNIKPFSTCYIEGAKNKSFVISNILNDLSNMKKSLANNNPFIVGIAVYESFESIKVAKSGYVPMPYSNEKILGGHTVICVGYDDNKQVWIMRNSWGSNWGDKGYFYLPYLYLLDSKLSSDLWNIKKIN